MSTEESEYFWGYGPDGRKRRPCPSEPEWMDGWVGRYHCNYCDELQDAGSPHSRPAENYEQIFGMEWPLGYLPLEETPDAS